MDCLKSLAEQGTVKLIELPYILEIEMIELNCLQSVSERDIDMILVEELQASEAFRRWFSTKVFADAVYKSKIGAWHSVSNSALGESDIVFLFVTNLDGTSAILIENKISASAQPNQGQRYQKRGALGQENSWWDEFKTCIVAPAEYLKSGKHTEEYDTEIAYEEIQSYFTNRQHQDERFEHKALVIEEGILQNRRGYQPIVDPAITQFINDYFAFAHEKYPEAEMDRPKPRPAGSTWISFHPKCLPDQSDITHQMTAGYVKLFLRGQAEQLDEIINRYSAHLPNGAEIMPAKKSAAIAIEVPKIADPWQTPFRDYITEVEAALNAVTDLILTVQKAERPS